MPSPIPKPTGRPRRGARTSSYGQAQPAKRLPKRDTPWHPSTAAEWKRLTSAPFTALWLPSDWDLAYRLLALRDRLNWLMDDAGASAAMLRAVLAEIRAAEAQLGVDPKSRASLRWMFTPDAQPAKRSLASVSTLDVPGQLSEARRREILGVAVDE